MTSAEPPARGAEMPIGAAVDARQGTAKETTNATDLVAEVARAPLPRPRPPRRAPRRLAAAVTALFLTVLAAGGYLAARGPAEDPVDTALARERARHDSLRAAQQRAYQRRLEQVRGELAALERRVAHRSDVDERMGRVQRAVAEVESSLQRRVDSEVERSIGSRPELAAARDMVRRAAQADAAAERLIARYAGSVCLIQGTYGFGRQVGKKWMWLREASPELLKGMELTSEQVPLMLEGDGPVFQVEYTGTGFLVDRRGVVLTNRHIAEPWWKNDAAEPLLQGDFEARFVHLRAYFPGREEPVEFDRGRTVIADGEDLAALFFAPFADMPAALEMAAADGLVAGRRVLLLGYPSGLDALLARTEEDLSAAGGAPQDVLKALAARDLVRPLPTQGFIGDVLDDRVVFDAPTAVGGSGGPLMDMEGRVVAVNFGILKAFRGANFGVPAPAATRLLERCRVTFAQTGGR